MGKGLILELNICLVVVLQLCCSSNTKL